MATVISKVATHTRQMANVFGKVATVQLDVATTPAEMATDT